MFKVENTFFSTQYSNVPSFYSSTNFSNFGGMNEWHERKEIIWR